MTSSSPMKDIPHGLLSDAIFDRVKFFEKTEVEKHIMSKKARSKHLLFAEKYVSNLKDPFDSRCKIKTVILRYDILGNIQHSVRKTPLIIIPTKNFC